MSILKRRNLSLASLDHDVHSFFFRVSIVLGGPVHCVLDAKGSGLSDNGVLSHHAHRALRCS
jgi:hypothetical protein